MPIEISDDGESVSGSSYLGSEPSPRAQGQAQAQAPDDLSICRWRTARHHFQECSLYFDCPSHVVERVLSAFGSERVFWGSDVTRLPVSYAEAIDFVAVALADRPSIDLENVMGRGLLEWFGCAPGFGVAT